MGEELVFKGTSRSETKNSGRIKVQSSLAKQSKNAMMSSINSREEQWSSGAKMSFKTFTDERMASLRTDGLSSSLDHTGLMHSQTDITKPETAEE